jgi:hypothetical protein
VSASAPIPCPACGAKVLPPARYCDLCGTSLGPGPAGPPQPRP